VTRLEPEIPPEPAPPTGHSFRRRLRHHGRHPVLRSFRIALGVLLVLLGALFGFVPFIPGWVLGLAGFSLLSTEIRAVRRVFVTIRRRFRLWRRARRRNGKLKGGL